MGIFNEKLQGVTVFLAEIPETVTPVAVYPQQRTEEIFACKSAKIAGQKYCAWKLLEYALRHSLGTPIEGVDFVKEKGGKWHSSACCFSLSHSGKIVAAAVSSSEVGVDIELGEKSTLEKLERIPFLTALELNEAERLDKGSDRARAEYLLAKWTAKESLFKAFGKGVFRPERVETIGAPVVTQSLVAFGENITVSVAGEGCCLAAIKNVIDYLG